MPTLELFDGPLSHLLLRLVLEALALHALRQLVSHSCRGARHREADAYLSSEVVLGELGAHFDCEAQAIAGLLVDERVDAEGRAVLAVNAVVHDEELAVRRVD